MSCSIKQNLLSALADTKTLADAGYPIPEDTISSIQSKYVESHKETLARSLGDSRHPN